MSAVLAPPEAPRLWSAEEAEAGRGEPPRLEAEPVAAALAVPEVQEVTAAWSTAARTPWAHSP